MGVVEEELKRRWEGFGGQARINDYAGCILT